MEKMELVNKSNGRPTYLPRETYESISNFIISTLKERGEITVHELVDYALENKSLKINGDLCWHLLRVKLDLENRGIIKVKLGIGSSKIQKIGLVNKKSKPAKKEFDADKL